ncbi:MAG: very short patch repair endonuclease [Verrucomicrobia subdivision 3 bacterium]|nr:very short patch repair endonuclease [Limisphaerales bacterium]
MSRIRGKNTSPELIVWRLLHRMGYRFRLHGKNLSGNWMCCPVVFGYNGTASRMARMAAGGGLLPSARNCSTSASTNAQSCR